VKKLVVCGAHVNLFARTDGKLQKALENLEPLRKRTNQKISCRRLDVTDDEATRSILSEEVKSFGVPYVVINCAGRAIPMKFEDISYRQFDETMKVNLYGCRNTIAALLPFMKDSGGLIVNTSSIAGIIGIFGYTDYSASKFALIGFSEALRTEVKKHNIEVKVLCPPDTDTPGFQNENLTKPEETQVISEGASLMTSDEVADVFFKEMPRKQLTIVPGISGKFNVIMKRLLPGLVASMIDKQIKRVGPS
jgi:3-dehydrosphinganine reductase